MQINDINQSEWTNPNERMKPMPRMTINNTNQAQWTNPHELMKPKPQMKIHETLNFEQLLSKDKAVGPVPGDFPIQPTGGPWFWRSNWSPHYWYLPRRTPEVPTLPPYKDSAPAAPTH